MTYDEKLVERVRAIFRAGSTYSEKRMFGAVCFMVVQNMAVGVACTELIVRTRPDNFEAALALSYAQPIHFTGNPMEEFAYVESNSLATDAVLAVWVERGVAFRSLST